jgi:hypothetical protein
MTYLLLGSLIVLSVPRDLVHHHDHDTEHEHHSEDSSMEDSDASIDQGHCFACEFDFDEAPEPMSFQFKLAEVAYQNFIETKLNLFASSEFDLFSLRGPPIV